MKTERLDSSPPPTSRYPAAKSGKIYESVSPHVPDRLGELIAATGAGGVVIHSVSPERPFGYVYHMMVPTFPYSWRLVNDCTIRFTSDFA